MCHPYITGQQRGKAFAFSSKHYLAKNHNQQKKDKTYAP